MKNLLLLICLFSNQLYFAQCDDEVLIKKLRGVWVKSTGNADTIKFSMRLGREQGFELILANRLKSPDPAGLYEFRVLANTMLLRWLASGYSGAEAINFSLDKNGQSLSIGNFYHAYGEDKTLSFRKIK